MSMERYEKYKPSGIEWIGEVPEHWDLKKIKFCFDVYAGATPKTENAEYWDGDIVWVTPADYKTEDKYINGGKKTITKKGYDSCNTQIVPVGSIIFSKRAPIGTVALSNVELCTNQGCLSCVPKDTNSTFYYYAMSVSTECFDLLGSGATFKEISADSFSNVKMPYPSLAEQEAIAAYLDARCADIDKVVATQEKRIALLKELKQSVITQAVTRGLNPDVKMKDSGVEWIGEVPEHWERISMKYFFYMKGRIGWQGLKADEFIDEGPYLITGTDFENGRVVWERCYHISQERYNQDPAIHVKRGDLLITKDGTVGKLALIDDMPDIASLNSHLLILRPYDANLITNNYVYWYLSSQIFKIYTGLTQSGSIMESLSQEKIGDFQMALPPIEEQKQIASYLDGRCADIDKQIEGVARQIELLREYKQSLITEVVTGKRKVC